MAEPARESPARPQAPYLAPLGLLLIAIAGLAPLLLESRPIEFIPPYVTDFAQTVTKVVAAVLLCIPLAVRDWVDRRAEPRAAFLTSVFLILAGLMTWWHAYAVDAEHGDWQRQLYWDILSQSGDDKGLRIPHQFRPLPYGFVRTLECITGDWWFSCVLYRWFFTFWFLWGAHRFARLFLPPGPALATLVPLAVLYPVSVLYYFGQLTDPLSHALFIFALIFLVQDRWLVLAATLALGILAKETVLLVTVSYFACYWWRGWPALLKTAALGVTCEAAYFAVRLPLGWRLGYGAINGTTELMILPNLFGSEKYNYPCSLVMNYLYPLLFVGSFLPLIVWGWRRIDGRLQAICLTLVPLVLLSNLCFGWMYESRNYMPLIPLLATMAGQALTVKARSTKQTA
ncbi:MAG TPA: hypothetical protein VGG61_16155 [Gemmataceae bacterium]